jgi:hypothetical protein
MKKNIIKILKVYHSLDENEKIEFQNHLNKNNEIKKLEDLSLRSSVASQLLNDIITPEGKSYFNVDWVAKNIMGFSDKEIKELRDKKSK